jgi:hypothetical protein
MPETNAGSKLRAKFVAIAPGITFTTRIESSSSSRRSVLEMQLTACLVAPDAGVGAARRSTRC